MRKKNLIKLSNNEKKFINNKINLKLFIKSRTNLRLNDNLIKILDQNKKKNKKILLTFEGHFFERIIFKYCNENKIHSFAYFFSIIRKNKSSVFYNFGRKYMPNSILTTGPVIKKYFNKNFKQGTINNIIDIGSSKVEKKKTIFKKK